MKRRITALTLAALMMLSLAACGEKTEETKADSTAVSESTAASAQAESTAVSASAESTAPEDTSLSGGNPEYAALDEYKYESDIPVVEGEYKPLECVKLADYENVKIDDNYVAPTDEDIEKRMKSYITPVEVTDKDAVVELGDTVAFAFDGGTDTMRGENDGLVIGSGNYIEDLENGLIGLPLGEADVDTVFPEDYWSSDLAGQKATFHVNIKKISRVPELTDEVVAAQEGLDCKTVDELREKCEKELKEEARAAADSDIELSLWQTVVEGSEFLAMPKSLIDDAAARFDESSVAQASAYGIPFGEYLAYAGVSAESYNLAKTEFIRATVQSYLVCDAIWEKENLSMDSKEAKAVIDDLKEANNKTEDELYEQFGKDVVENYVKTYVVLDVLKDKMVVVTE